MKKFTIVHPQASAIYDYLESGKYEPQTPVMLSIRFSDDEPHKLSVSFSKNEENQFKYLMAVLSTLGY